MKLLTFLKYLILIISIITLFITVIFLKNNNSKETYVNFAVARENKIVLLNNEFLKIMEFEVEIDQSSGSRYGRVYAISKILDNSGGIYLTCNKSMQNCDEIVFDANGNRKKYLKSNKLNINYPTFNNSVTYISEDTIATIEYDSLYIYRRTDSSKERVLQWTSKNGIGVGGNFCVDKIEFIVEKNSLIFCDSLNGPEPTEYFNKILQFNLNTSELSEVNYSEKITEEIESLNIFRTIGQKIYFIANSGTSFHTYFGSYDMTTNTSKISKIEAKENNIPGTFIFSDNLKSAELYTWAPGPVYLFGTINLETFEISYPTEPIPERKTIESDFQIVVEL